MIRIVVRRFGDIKERFVEKVLEILNDCYNRLGTHPVDIVEVYIFEKSSSMNAFMNYEKRKLGIETSAFEESFLAVHDAWQGTPRIMVAHDKMIHVPKLVGIGALRHEAAHTALHGSLEYYSFSTPMFLIELERNRVVSRQVIRDLVYLASIAVKDYEVTRLLYEKGYAIDQVAYNEYYLKPSEEELEAWKLSEKNKTAILLFLVSALKTACCATPLLKDERYGEEILKTITGSMNFLPQELSARLLKTLEAASKFGRNTHENVDRFMKEIIDELVIKGKCLDTKENR
ncbi:MAG: hypothetical protein ABSF44_13600 [Candidatus Bathyarchaeia archaeon]|jgi:hypothetical protein